MAIFGEKDSELPSAYLHRHPLSNQPIERGILRRIKGHRDICEQGQRRPVHDFTAALNILNIDIFAVGFVLPLRHRLSDITLHERKNIIPRNIMATNRSLVSNLPQKSKSFFKARR